MTFPQTIFSGRTMTFLDCVLNCWLTIDCEISACNKRSLRMP